MANRRIAVLGSNSFSGSDFIDLLLSDPQNEVLGSSRSPQKGPLFIPYLQRDLGRFRFLQADWNTQLEQLMRALDEFEPEYVVNFGAQSEVAESWTYPEHWFQTNTVSLAKLVNQLKDRKYLRRYVYISSAETYGSCEGSVKEDAPLNPTTPYAASRAAADLLQATYAKNFGFPLVTIRSTNYYGAHQQLFKIMPRTAIYLKLKRIVELHGGGQAVKSYIHIRDVSRGELTILEQGVPGNIYHLSPDRGYAVREVVETICREFGVPFERATKTVADRIGQDAAYLLDSQKVRTQFGWRPQVSLDEGVRGVVGWVNANWDAIQHEPLEYAHKP